MNQTTKYFTHFVRKTFSRNTFNYTSIYLAGYQSIHRSTVSLINLSLIREIRNKYPKKKTKNLAGSKNCVPLQSF